ncbi:hypothetical protein IP92_04872 [Pseudoduganella flava]|uniref:Uncharacterized protein n=1 Tax=Pseudoduganella flava TaxID=871742 RepID=A0A562PHG4_9BURK|nr:hypothetical protein [Pseudoduganella flava]QGZ42658.1 hypothetical protein GO485_28900 [Pseudoduganella flava]TWI43818.1 hypothetical protein IP92_04872 [Pseudoduganella flava]
MSHLNAGLSQADFQKDEVIRASDREGFKGDTVRVVTLTGPFKLYKLTSDGAPEWTSKPAQEGGTGQRRMTPWWTPVAPYEEDTEGAAGRFRQAYLNGIDMSSMVRFMSAVKVEWNDLEEYVEITIKDGCKVSCFWGEFAPMNLSDDPVKNKDRRDKQSRTGSAELGYEPAVLPFETQVRPGVQMPFKIGVLRAWQFFIPNLNNDWLKDGEARTRIDAHNMEKLGVHLGVNLGHVKLLRLGWLLLKNFQLRTQAAAPQRPRDAMLLQMDRCLVELFKLSSTPLDSLRLFRDLGDSYVKHAPAPALLKQVVGQFVMDVTSILDPGQRRSAL